MNAQMYDPKHVAARLAARRVQAGQVGQAQEKPMAKRYNLTSEELAELRELLAGDGDEEALGAFAQRYNVHGNSMRGFVTSIRRQLAEEATAVEAGPAVVQEPPLWKDIQREIAEEAAQAAQAVVVPPPPTLPAPDAPNGLTAAPPAARIGTIIDWLTTIRAMRDELREHGVMVEGTVSITVDL